LGPRHDLCGQTIGSSCTQLAEPVCFNCRKQTARAIIKMDMKIAATVNFDRIAILRGITRGSDVQRFPEQLGTAARKIDHTALGLRPKRLAQSIYDGFDPKHISDTGLVNIKRHDRSGYL
jgi:hypothetical protein